MDRDALARLGIGDDLIAKRERLDGERALRFLAGLPSLVQAWCDRLGLDSPRIMPGGVLSVALACIRVSDCADVVLKLSASDATSAPAEAAALRAWEGVGACALLYTSDTADAMLLEAIRPGTAVKPGADDAADARCAAELLRTLHRVPVGHRPAVVPDAIEELQWRFARAHKLLDGPSHARGLVSHDDIDDAFARARALHEGRTETVMCHGDFMNKNLLLDGGRVARAGGRPDLGAVGHPDLGAVGRPDLGAGGGAEGGGEPRVHGAAQWRAIDPRPCTGDPCLDAGFWALAHRPGVDVRDRCGLVSRERGIDAGRVWAWARVFAVSEAVLVTEAARARAHHSLLVA